MATDDEDKLAALAEEVWDDYQQIIELNIEFFQACIDTARAGTLPQVAEFTWKCRSAVCRKEFEEDATALRDYFVDRGPGITEADIKKLCGLMGGFGMFWPLKQFIERCNAGGLSFPDRDFFLAAAPPELRRQFQERFAILDSFPPKFGNPPT